MGPQVTQDSAATGQAGAPPWYRRVTKLALAPAAIYVGVRLVGLIILGLLADHHDRDLGDLLKSWDGDWYIAIADHGYAGVPERFTDAAGNHTEHTTLAFFPAYPVLVRFVALITGTETLTAALLVSLIAGIAAAYAIARIGKLVSGRTEVGLLMVALWAGAPMAITLSMAYTEGLFTALAAWALVGVLEKRWLLAGLYSLFAGLSRPTASVLIAVVGVAAIVTLVQSRDRWMPLVCAVLCPLGLIGYWAFVGGRTGTIFGWFDIQRAGWYSRFDFGADSGKFIGETLATGGSVMEVVTVFVVIGAVLLAALTVVARLPWPLVVYGIGVVILVIGSTGIAYSKARLLIPAFPLLLPIAIGLAGRRRATMIAVVIGFVLLGSWFSAYSLTGWRYAI